MSLPKPGRRTFVKWGSPLREFLSFRKRWRRWQRQQRNPWINPGMAANEAAQLFRSARDFRSITKRIGWAPQS